MDLEPRQRLDEEAFIRLAQQAVGHAEVLETLHPLEAAQPDGADGDLLGGGTAVILGQESR